jgi:acetamidase/formamidase
MTTTATPGFDAVATGLPILQPGTGPIAASTYLPASPENTLWGRLPCESDRPRAVVAPGAVVTVDTISHEGLLEDQGRDPRGFFARYGVDAAHVLADAQALAESGTAHDFELDGPHVVTGPIAVAGARPGDLLAISVLDLAPRVPYGLVSARHGFGALPGELPAAPGPVFTFATATAGGE